MATTTSNSTASTTYTYNKDYSAADAYKPAAVTQPTVNTPTYDVAKQDDIDTYASGNNVDYTYKEADLANKYQQLQDAALENTLYGIAQSQNNYNQSMNDTNRSVIDALRSETASAIANGTSRGVTDANVLKSILGLQQESVADATELAQQYGQAYKDYGENSAQAWIDANSTAANYQNQLLADTLEKFETGQTSLDNRYTADAGLAATQYESDANLEAQRYAADAGIYNDLLTTIANQQTGETTTASSTTTAPDTDYSSYYSGSYNGNDDGSSDNSNNNNNDGDGSGTENNYKKTTAYTSSKTKAALSSLVNYDAATQKAQMDTASSSQYASLAAAKKAANKVKGAPLYRVNQFSDGTNTYYEIEWLEDPTAKTTTTTTTAPTTSSSTVKQSYRY